MSKIFKKIAAIAMASVMTVSMVVPVHASTTTCDHFGKVYTRELEPHYTHEQHSNGHGGICTITIKYRTILTCCASCGLLASNQVVERSHSDSSCTNK